MSETRRDRPDHALVGFFNLWCKRNKKTPHVTIHIVGLYQCQLPVLRYFRGLPCCTSPVYTPHIDEFTNRHVSASFPPLMEQRVIRAHKGVPTDLVSGASVLVVMITDSLLCLLYWRLCRQSVPRSGLYIADLPVRTPFWTRPDHYFQNSVPAVLFVAQPVAVMIPPLASTPCKVYALRGALTLFVFFLPTPSTLKQLERHPHSHHITHTQAPYPRGAFRLSCGAQRYNMALPSQSTRRWLVGCCRWSV